MTMKISEKIKKLRQEKGWSQAQLAKKLNILPQHISRYERGIIIPSAETMAKIANAFGISIDYMLNETSENSSEFKLKDKELQRYFEKVDELDEKDKEVIKRVIESFIKNKTAK